MTNLIIGLVLVVVCAGLSWFAAPWLHNRGFKQPIAFDPEAETALIEACWSRPGRVGYLDELSSEYFAVRFYQHIWSSFTTATDEMIGDDLVKKLRSKETKPNEKDDLAKQADAIVQENQDTWRKLVYSSLKENDLATKTLDAVDLSVWVDEEKDPKVMDAAVTVYSNGEDRLHLSGPWPIIATDNPNSLDRENPPIMRGSLDMSSKRRVVVTAASAVAAFFLPYAASWAGFTGLSLALALGALLVLLVTTVAVAWIDADTFSIDMPIWAVGTVLAWALAILACFVADVASRAWTGVVVVLVVGIIFEVIARAYKWIRGIEGQGFGDTLIIIGTVGVPTALTGSIYVAYWSIMAGFIIAIVAWSTLAIRGKAGRQTYFAFGPWLAAGWVVGLMITYMYVKI